MKYKCKLTLKFKARVDFTIVKYKISDYIAFKEP